MIIDIDNFKQANDIYGHIYGDEILTSVSVLLRKTVRHNAVITRLGGDEFIVFIYPFVAIGAANGRRAVPVIPAIRLQTNRLPTILLYRHAVARIAARCFHNAGRALYQANHKGKNKYETLSLI